MRSLLVYYARIIMVYMSALSKAFGNFLKKIRDERDLSQSEISAMAQTDEATVSRWESGKFLPGEKKAKLLFEKLKIEELEIGLAGAASAQIIMKLNDIQKNLEAIPTSPNKDKVVPKRLKSGTVSGAALALSKLISKIDNDTAIEVIYLAVDHLSANNVDTSSLDSFLLLPNKLKKTKG